MLYGNESWGKYQDLDIKFTTKSENWGVGNSTLKGRAETGGHRDHGRIVRDIEELKVYWGQLRVEKSYLEVVLVLRETWDN